MEYCRPVDPALLRHPSYAVHEGEVPVFDRSATPSNPVEWSIVVPFFNEEEFICDTLRSAAAQQVPFDLILVDNGSTDCTNDVAARECNRLGIHFRLVREPRRGKVHALEAGIAHVRTAFVATFDADTIYPPEYLSMAALLLRKSSAVCAQAYYSRTAHGGWRRLYPGMKLLLFTWLLPDQAHNGGAGQVFRAEALRRAGGFDPQRWKFVLEDHEIIHRVAKLGKVRCSWRFWCAPARRHHDRPSVRWNFVERIAYHLTPTRFSDWYFYRFLRPRLEKRSPPNREELLTTSKA